MSAGKPTVEMRTSKWRARNGEPAASMTLPSASSQKVAEPHDARLARAAPIEQQGLQSSSPRSFPVIDWIVADEQDLSRRHARRLDHGLEELTRRLAPAGL